MVPSEIPCGKLTTVFLVQEIQGLLCLPTAETPRAQKERVGSAIYVLKLPAAEQNINPLFKAIFSSYQ